MKTEFVIQSLVSTLSAFVTPYKIPLNILKAAWAGKVSRYSGMVHEAGRSVQLLPVPISTLGGWHPDAHRALCSVARAIAARGMSTFNSAKGILFQRHAALLVTNNALYLMSGLVSLIWGGTYYSTSVLKCLYHPFIVEIKSGNSKSLPSSWCTSPICQAYSVYI